MRNSSSAPANMHTSSPETSISPSVSSTSGAPPGLPSAMSAPSRWYPAPKPFADTTLSLASNSSDRTSMTNLCVLSTARAQTSIGNPSPSLSLEDDKRPFVMTPGRKVRVPETSHGSNDDSPPTSGPNKSSSPPSASPSASVGSQPRVTRQRIRASLRVQGTDHNMVCGHGRRLKAKPRVQSISSVIVSQRICVLGRFT